MSKHDYEFIHRRRADSPEQLHKGLSYAVVNAPWSSIRHVIMMNFFWLERVDEFPAWASLEGTYIEQTDSRLTLTVLLESYRRSECI